MGKYLITGITGFVGPHLVDLLVREGHCVCGLIRCSNGAETSILDTITIDVFNEIEFIYGDLLFRDRIDFIINSYKFDGIFHLAAQSHPPTSFNAPRDTFEVNAVGTVNLVDSVLRRQPDCKFMNCSTS